MLELRNIEAFYGETQALFGASLSIGKAEVVALLGPNGAGKTTTIRLVLGLLAPTAGELRVLGFDMPAGGPQVRRRCGVVLEQHGLYEGMSVRASLEFAARAYGLSRRDAARRVSAVVGGLGLAQRLDERPQALSRGMRQRMALARALVGRPELLVLDEPTNGLDAEAAAALRAELASLVGSGSTIFVTTHLLAEAERMCDVVTVVKNGRAVATGAPDELRRAATVSAVRIEGPGVDRVAARALVQPWTKPAAGVAVVAVSGPEQIPVVVSALVAAGADIMRVEPVGQTLEAAFLQLIGNPPPNGRDEASRVRGEPASDVSAAAR